MFGLGMPELIVILVIAIFVFGGKKLPEIGAGLGKAIGSFKKGLNEVEETAADLKKSLPPRPCARWFYPEETVADLKKSLPVVKEISEVKESLEQAGTIINPTDK